MNAPQDSHEHDEPKYGGRIADGRDAGDDHAPADSPGVDLIQTVSPEPPHDSAESEREEQPNTPEKWWKGFWYDIKATDIVMTAFTGFLLIVSYRQNGLIDTSNTIAGDAAQAAKDAAVAAQRTYSLAKSGEESAKEALDATKKTAEAAKATADGVASTAASITAALEQSRQANQIADRAAFAAGVSASATSESNRIAAEASEKQLRAYISVVGTSFKFNKAAQRVEGTIVLKNSGFTFAHNVRPVARLVCVPTADLGVPVGAFDPLPAPSIGPGTEFVIQLEAEWGGVTPISQMTAWADGAVHYTDEFGKQRVTAFRFVPNQRPISATEFQMVLDSVGNHAN